MTEAIVAAAVPMDRLSSASPSAMNDRPVLRSQSTALHDPDVAGAAMHGLHHMTNKSDAISDAAERFSSAANSIMTQVRLRPDKCAASPFENGISYFKRESYNLIIKQLSLPYGMPSIKLLLKDNQIKVDNSFTNRIFYWALRAIDPVSIFMDKKRRLLYSNQMIYAYLHQVPPEYLIGFLYQSGSSDLITKKVRNFSQEQEFIDLRRRYSAYENQWSGLPRS